MRRSLHACTSLTVIGIATLASASAGMDDGFRPPAPFTLTDEAVGRAAPATPTPAYLASSRIAAVGDGALVIDADSGELVLADAASKPIAQLAVGRDAGLLAYHPETRTAYVADRRGDRIVVVTIGQTLSIRASWKTPAEPFGVALTPGGAYVLVTSVADRTLTAFEAKTGGVAWQTKLDQDPRGVAVSPDGKRALVTYLASGKIDEVSLATRAVSHLGVAHGSGGSVARGAFATLFMGPELAVVPFQRSQPGVASAGEMEDSGGSYGGSFVPPITQHLAFIRVETGRLANAQIAAQQPRALAWDGARDALYVAGMGTDSLLQLERASQVDIRMGFTARLGTRTQSCGPDGVAVAPNGDVMVWCSFSRSVARVNAKAKVERGPMLAATHLTELQHAGMVRFHTATEGMSAFAQVSCANCHFEGRADGLAWLIHGMNLQTPVLAGRMSPAMAPFKWDGTAKDLPTSLRETMGRLGGEGLPKKQIEALAAYLEAMPAVRTPTRAPAAVARGNDVFEWAGCSNCHDGTTYTDGAKHKLRGTLKRADTPSLIGLAASAPYFHDGSAATLEAVLRERGGVHGMSDAALQMTDTQIADLTAFLESL